MSYTNRKKAQGRRVSRRANTKTQKAQRERAKRYREDWDRGKAKREQRVVEGRPELIAN